MKDIINCVILLGSDEKVATFIAFYTLNVLMYSISTKSG